MLYIYLTRLVHQQQLSLPLFFLWCFPYQLFPFCCWVAAVALFWRWMISASLFLFIYFYFFSFPRWGAAFELHLFIPRAQPAYKMMLKQKEREREIEKRFLFAIPFFFYSKWNQKFGLRECDMRTKYQIIGYKDLSFPFSLFLGGVPLFKKRFLFIFFF